METNYTDPIFQETLNSVPERIKREVDRSFDIAASIESALKRKGWTKTQLAQKTGKNCAEVTRWLSGTHNFTLRTLAIIEEALGGDLIHVCGKESSFQSVCVVFSHPTVLRASGKQTLTNKLYYVQHEQKHTNKTLGS